MALEQLVNRTSQSWHAYAYKGMYEQHRIEFELWAWKDEREAAEEAVARIEQQILAEGYIPLRSRAWIDRDPLFYEKIIIEVDVGLHNPPIYNELDVETAIAPLIVLGGIIAVLYIIDWIRPGTAKEIVEWLYKNVGEPIAGITLEILKPLLILGGLALGAVVVVQSVIKL